MRALITASRLSEIMHVVQSLLVESSQKVKARIEGICDVLVRTVSSG